MWESIFCADVLECGESGRIYLCFGVFEFVVNEYEIFALVGVFFVAEWVTLVFVWCQYSETWCRVHRILHPAIKNNLNENLLMLIKQIPNPHVLQQQIPNIPTPNLHNNLSQRF